MHLCQPCLPQFEDPPPELPTQPLPWAGSYDPHKRDERERELALNRPCPGPWCNGRILPSDTRIRLCASCAYKDKICQHCQKPTVTQAEHASMRTERGAQETMIDLFTILIKRYGYQAARALFRERLGDLGTHAATSLELRLDEVDTRIQKRELLQRIYGRLDPGHSHAIIRCSRCLPPLAGGAPALSQASGCGHWTAGVNQAWCYPCADRKGHCVSCGRSIEPPAKEIEPPTEESEYS